MTLENLYALVRKLLKDSREYPAGEERALLRRIFQEISGATYQDMVMCPQRETGATEDSVASVMRRVAENEPLEYIFGRASFLGLDFKAAPGVLIPRPETEELVLMAAAEIRKRPRRCNVLDIGTGSGCIPVSLASMLPGHDYHAVDVSDLALDVARQNASAHGCKVDFRKMDILAWESACGDAQACCDVIISNPPYVMEGEKALMDANVLDYEPHLALFVSDSDPLVFYRAISGFAARMLRPGGKLFFEINERLGKETAALMESRGFCGVEVSKDLFGKYRFACGAKPSI